MPTRWFRISFAENAFRRFIAAAGRTLESLRAPDSLALVAGFYADHRAQHARITDGGDRLLWQWGPDADATSFTVDLTRQLIREGDDQPIVQLTLTLAYRWTPGRRALGRGHVWCSGAVGADRLRARGPLVRCLSRDRRGGPDGRRTAHRGALSRPRSVLPGEGDELHPAAQAELREDAADVDLTVVSLTKAESRSRRSRAPCIARKISFSRGESASIASSARPAAAELPEQVRSPPARYRWPAWTVRMAASRNSGSASLVRNPLAPARIARATASSRRNVVTTMMRGSRCPAPARINSRRGEAVDARHPDVHQHRCPARSARRPRRPPDRWPPCRRARGPSAIR